MFSDPIKYGNGRAPVNVRDFLFRVRTRPPKGSARYARSATIKSLPARKYAKRNVTYVSDGRRARAGRLNVTGGVVVVIIIIAHNITC